jgi:cellobiose phosphorylase
MAKFETKYGYFTNNGEEYVIKTYKTPKPWINVISNGDYGLVISQAGGGFSWLNHSEFNRLNRWHQDLIRDDWGKYFYIKDNDTGKIWSPLWMPVKIDLDFYECRYGFGYSKFKSVFDNIEVDLTLFIPVDEKFEIWSFEFRNRKNTPVNLSVYSYFEWCLGSSADHHREFHKTFIETHFDDKMNTMFATKRLWEIPLGDRGHWNIEYPHWGFLSSNKKITGYDGDKESFLGQYGSLENPSAIKNNVLGKNTGKWNDSIGTVKIDFNIKANGSDHAAFYIGIGENWKDINKSLKKYSGKNDIDKALEDVKKTWSRILGETQVETPDEGMDFLVNKWLKYQAICGRLWARTAYYQQSGAFGFRDQLQDSLVYLPIDPELTLNQIKLHARHQFKDGTVLHWWHPITETGLQTKMTDDLLWLPFVIIQYLKETDDFRILSLKEPFYDNPKKNVTLFEHSTSAIDRVLERFSKRGLPLIGAGDWNDGLSAVGLEMKGESIWLAEFLFLILNEFSVVCRKIGKNKTAKKYEQSAAKLKKAFNKYAWDGEWFYRATKDNGEKIGSRKNKEGKIYLNAQTWAVISGIADKDKQEKSIEAVTTHLLKKNGTLLLYPAYTRPDKMIGYLSRYAPGRRENGGVYSHAAAWSIWAYSLLRKMDKTFQAYKRLSPVYNGLDTDEYIAEPYVMPGNIDGPDSPDYGMGGWTWYTGSASWFYKMIMERILGIRAEAEGLLIDPCIPVEWDKYSVTRRFRGTRYNIHFENQGGNSRFSYMIVNGERTEDNILNIKSDKTVNVQVYLA